MTQDEIIRMAREAGFEHIAEAEYWHPLFERFAALVAAHEREECAKVCEQLDDESYPHTRKWPSDCAAAIRARSDNDN